MAAERILENLTRSPSTDTLADTEAVARELAAAEAAAQAAETNTLILKYRPDGSLDYRGRIRPTDVPVATAWLKQADRKFAGTDGFEDDRPREQRRGDHLLTTLRHALTTSSGSSNGSGGTGGGRTYVHVNVTTTLDALRDAVTGAGVLDSGGTLSAAELRRLACDAGITPLVLGGPSEVLDYGRTRRSFPQAPRRALVVRDRGCIAPGCDRAPADCDGHHQWEWDQADPPTSTTAPCSASTTTSRSTGKAGTCNSPATATPNSSHPHRSTPHADPDNTTASSSPSSPADADLRSVEAEDCRAHPPERVREYGEQDTLVSPRTRFRAGTSREIRRGHDGRTDSCSSRSRDRSTDVHG